MTELGPSDSNGKAFTNVTARLPAAVFAQLARLADENGMQPGRLATELLIELVPRIERVAPRHGVAIQLAKRE